MNKYLLKGFVLKWWNCCSLYRCGCFLGEGCPVTKSGKSLDLIVSGAFSWHSRTPGCCRQAIGKMANLFLMCWTQPPPDTWVTTGICLMVNGSVFLKALGHTCVWITFLKEARSYLTWVLWWSIWDWFKVIWKDAGLEHRSWTWGPEPLILDLFHLPCILLIRCFLCLKWGGREQQRCWWEDCFATKIMEDGTLEHKRVLDVNH